MYDYISTTLRSINVLKKAQESVTTRTISRPLIPLVDFFSVLSDIRKVNLYWSKMKEADEVGNKNFLKANDEMLDVKKVANVFYEGLGKNGTNLSGLNINKLQSNLFNENELMEDILDRLNGEGELSDSEERILYYFIQNQLFDDEKRKTMDTIIHSIETNSELVIDHLNDNVLQTKSALFKEILLTEMYLYTGNQHPRYGHLSKEENAILTVYLENLHNYRRAIEEAEELDPWLKNLGYEAPLLAKVELYDYKRTDELEAFYLETIFRIGKYSSEDTYERDDFLADNNHELSSMYYNSKISHYENGSAFHRENNLNAREDYENHTNDFITSKILSAAIEVLSKGNSMVNAMEILIEYADGKSEMELDMTQDNAELAAHDFGLEVQILERETKTTDYVPCEINFLPTKETYEIMERWKEVVDSGSEIPYPEEYISQNNWFLISEFYYIELSKMKESFLEEYEYIFDK